MKKKSILSVFILAVFYYLIISLYSCTKDNNPIIPPPPPPVHPDTADKYVWAGYNTVIDLMNIYVADTDKIYVIGNFWLAQFDGQYLVPYNLNDLQFNATYVYGYDKNNIFVEGFYYKNGLRYPELKKITNGAITSYNIGTISDVLHDMLVVGPNQVWISDSYFSKVYYFNNGSIKEYTLSTTDSLVYQFFYMDKNNDLYIFAIKTSNQINGDFYTYKLINDNFVLQSTECFGYDPCLSPRLFRCGSDILMSTTGLSKLKYFNGNEWISHSDSDYVAAQASRIGGVSKDSLIMINGGGVIFTYGLNYWRKEKYAPSLEGSPNLYSFNAEMKFGNVYIAYWGHDHSTLLIGKANKNTKNK